MSIRTARKNRFAALSSAMVWCLLEVIYACAPSQELTPVVEAPPELQTYGADLPPEQYPEEIRRIQVAMKSQPDTPTGRNAHLYLAQLHWSHANPNRDYRSALMHLEAHLSKAPQAIQQPEIHNWQTILIEVVRLSDANSRQKRQIDALNTTLGQYQRKNKSLNENLRGCNADNMRLIKDKLELKQAIQKLQRLDLKHEEKRRSYR